jgi:hypothetical protein
MLKYDKGIKIVTNYNNCIRKFVESSGNVNRMMRGCDEAKRKTCDILRKLILVFKFNFNKRVPDTVSAG